MSRTRQDQAFWQIVKDLSWKLEDRPVGSAVPAPEPEFGHVPDRTRRWRISRPVMNMVVAFVFGGTIVAAGFTVPLLVAPVALLGVIVAMASTTHRS